jgi:zinc transport system ATP-binding protein
MTKHLLSVRNLCVQLGDKAILRQVDLDLERGRITALIGLNGSGKTTLLRALLKEVPFTGTIEFHCGHDHAHPMPSHIGYVPQKLSVDARLPLTVRDLLAMALQRWPVFLGIHASTERRMAELLGRVKADLSLLDKPVEKISGGELQRVLLALALFPAPELLLLDEPAQGIDFQDEELFYDIIAGLSRHGGVTILLVSHDISVVSKHADHVLCLKDGRIQCQGLPQTILSHEMLQRTFGEQKGLFTHDHAGDSDRINYRETENTEKRKTEKSREEKEKSS